MKRPTRQRVIETLNFEISTLKDSFTNLGGRDKGQITQQHIIAEIACLEEATRLIEANGFAEDCYTALRVITNKLASRLRRIASIIDGVEGRCMAVDGPVTKTCGEITDRELKAIYRLAQARISDRERSVGSLCGKGTARGQDLQNPKRTHGRKSMLRACPSPPKPGRKLAH